MNGNCNSIESNSNNYTGDPLIDSGLIAIEILGGKKLKYLNTEELKNLADNLLDIYLTPAWTKELFSIFPNSTYIQCNKNYDHKNKSQEFLYELIDNIHFKNSDNYCVFCGNPSFIRKSGDSFVKTHIPLIGSTAVTNFFPSLKTGIDVCSKCVLAIQFAPLLYHKIGGKPSCISCNNIKILEDFGNECINHIKENMSIGGFESNEKSGVFDEGFKNPHNALFNLAYSLLKKGRYYNHNLEFVIYRIDNYNQDPAGVSIYKLPNNVFQFVISLMTDPENKSLWFSFISRYYKRKKNIKEGIFWKETPNIIHDYLINNKSILKYFKDDKNKKNIVSWFIVKNYMSMVRNMNKQRLEEIKEFADQIALCINESNNIKRVNEIASAPNFNLFKNRLQIIMKDWQKLGKDYPLFTYDKYINSIIPEDYFNWRDVQNLIVIRLYEKLHDKLKIKNNEEDTDGLNLLSESYEEEEE